MLSIKFIRENIELVKENMQKKGRDIALLDRVLELDKTHKTLIYSQEQLRKERNELSKQINLAKKEGKDTSDILKQVKELPEKVKQLTQETDDIKEQLDQLLQKIPNMMAQTVPIGKNDSDNVVLQTFGTPKKTDVQAHQHILEKLHMADFESAARVSGNGFYYLQGDIALLNQALIQFAIQTMTKHGFTYVETPLMLRSDIINNVTDLHDQENQIYKIQDEDLYLIGTSEHSLIGRYVKQTIQEQELPITHTSYSMCFRKEKGAHGLDERGLFRTHQFNKVEMIVICKPEDSREWYKKLQQITIDIFNQLELPIRVLQICSGDLSDNKFDQVDIEAYSQRKDDYIEVGSCSNLTDAQSQMLGIRVQGKEKYYPHTLNNTAIATSRALVAIIENHTQKDGSIYIPKALQPFMGKEYIGK
ncbi:MAG: serine--tRNA ligase [Candidatus Woesearchaeota archaeon]